MADDDKSASELVRDDHANRWYFFEGGVKHTVPKLPILLGFPEFYPPGQVTMPDGSKRQILVEPIESEVHP